MTRASNWFQRNRGVVIVLIAIFMGAVYFVQVADERERSQCQTQYNQAFAENLRIRSELSAQRTEALDAVVAGVGSLVLNPPTTLKARDEATIRYRELFSNYAVAVELYNRNRADNPLPDLPSC